MCYVWERSQRLYFSYTNVIKFIKLYKMNIHPSSLAFEIHLLIKPFYSNRSLFLCCSNTCVCPCHVRFGDWQGTFCVIVGAPTHNTWRALKTFPQEAHCLHGINNKQTPHVASFEKYRTVLSEIKSNRFISSMDIYNNKKLRLNR